MPNGKVIVYNNNLYANHDDSIQWIVGGNNYSYLNDTINILKSGTFGKISGTYSDSASGNDVNSITVTSRITVPNVDVFLIWINNSTSYNTTSTATHNRYIDNSTYILGGSHPNGDGTGNFGCITVGKNIITSYYPNSNYFTLYGDIRNKPLIIATSSTDEGYGYTSGTVTINYSYEIYYKQ